LVCRGEINHRTGLSKVVREYYEICIVYNVGDVLDYSPCGLVTTLVAQGYRTPYYKGFATNGEGIA